MRYYVKPDPHDPILRSVMFMIMNASVEAEVKALTEKTNQWLASLTVKELEETCSRGDKGECFVSFEDFPASDVSKASILSDLLPLMCGVSAELKFDYGAMGSIFFDAEVPEVDGSKGSRPVRVALVPPQFHPDGVQHMFHVLCLRQMYS